MASTWQIRPATPEDVPALARIIAEAFEVYRDHLTPPSSSLGKSPAAVAEELTRAEAFIALGGDTPVGCVFLEPQGERLYLGRLAVVPAWQGRGVARALLGVAETVAREQGFQEMSLSVRLALGELRAFYERQGYQKAAYGTHAGFDAPTYVSLVKRLSPRSERA